MPWFRYGVLLLNFQYDSMFMYLNNIRSITTINDKHTRRVVWSSLDMPFKCRFSGCRQDRGSAPQSYALTSFGSKYLHMYLSYKRS